MGSETEQSTRSKACLPSAYNWGLAQMTWASARSLRCLGWVQGTLKRSQRVPSQVHTRNSWSRVTQGVRRYLRANSPLPRSTPPPKKGCFTWRTLSPVSWKQAFTFTQVVGYTWQFFSENVLDLYCLINNVWELWLFFPLLRSCNPASCNRNWHSATLFPTRI